MWIRERIEWGGVDVKKVLGLRDLVGGGYRGFKGSGEWDDKKNGWGGEKYEWGK